MSEQEILRDVSNVLDAAFLSFPHVCRFLKPGQFLFEWTEKFAAPDQKLSSQRLDPTGQRRLLLPPLLRSVENVNQRKEEEESGVSVGMGSAVSPDLRVPSAGRFNGRAFRPEFVGAPRPLSPRFLVKTLQDIKQRNHYT